MIDKLSVALGMMIGILSLILAHYASMELGNFGVIYVMFAFIFSCFLLIEIINMREYKPGHLFDKGNEKQLLKYQALWKKEMGNKSVEEMLHPERKGEE